MIDLHLHLDGSLPPSAVISLAKMQRIPLPSYDENILIKHLCVPQDCESLNEYLKCFSLPLTFLQTPAAISKAVYLLLEELKKQRLIYAEIRFAPQLHTVKGLSQREAVEAALDGRNRSGFLSNLILCCMRGVNNESENLETVHVAKEFLGSGVAAVDLAGAEALYKTASFRSIFELASRLDVPFTIHAGEADGAESVRCAVEFGAKRIGHGIRSIEDESVMKLLRDKGVCLEMCPTSNLQTKAVDRIDNYPLRKFMDFGIKVTVNTDNMTVSRTTIANEYKLLSEKLGITSSEIHTLLENAVDASFADDDQKKIMREQINRNIRM